MKAKIVIFLIGFLLFQIKVTAAQDEITIYLIPGQGSDSRIFSKFNPGPGYDIKNIEYFTPFRRTSMKDFAIALSQQIDTTKPFIIVGVSLGGMIATEMADFLNPEKVIIVSSAKCRKELPSRYRMQKALPVYRMFTPKAIKNGAFVMQPIVEPDRSICGDVFEAMLNDKDPVFLKRTIEMIMKWDRKIYSDKIIHLHGNNDNTIPIKNVKCDYVIEGGSHMMMLTNSGIINLVICGLLHDVN